MNVGSARQQQLLRALACPRCHGTVDLRDATWSAEAVVDADIDCVTCGTVGVIRTYRPSFFPDDIDGWSPKGLAEHPLTAASIIETNGTWTNVAAGRLGISAGACLTGTTSAPGLAVHFGTHQWGGTGVVTLGDASLNSSLYSYDPGLLRVVACDGPAQAPVERSWSVLVAPSDNPNSGGDQAIVSAICELVEARDAPPLVHRPANRGNSYPSRFSELLNSAPGDAVVLDLGGGDRCHEDPRVINFEYMKFAAADFFGDGLNLPLADESVDLILSQAVLEHVPNPQRAVDEMRRVLRPDGRVYAEFAFMQPLHAVPYHYYNITPHGAALLFSEWDVEHTGSFGGLAETLGWFLRLLDARTRLGDESVDAMIDTAARLDATLTPFELDFIASAVYVEATPRK